jgi:hypothetical protein
MRTVVDLRLHRYRARDAELTDGRYATNSPYIVATASGRLLLTSMHARKTADDSFANEDYQIVFINEGLGTGSWSWTPGPQPVAHAAVPSPCYMNYSPHLLLSESGASLRYTAASQDGTDPCAERTWTANAGSLPYASSFDGGLAAGWKSYGGCWTVVAGVYSDTCGAAAQESKALAGSTAWTNYRVEADVRIDTPGANAGLLVRLTNPDVGVDAHRGYYVGVGDTLFIGRQNYSYTLLTSTPIAAGVQVGQFIHITVDVVGCDLSVSAVRAGTTDVPTTLDYSDPGCPTAGAIGVRDFGGSASFRSVRVTAL